MIHRLANVYDSSIGDSTKIAAFAEVGGATIGERCKIQAFAFLCPGVELDDEVFIGPHVCFTNDRHPRAVGSWTPLPTRVGRGASIGAGSIILPGVTIGAGAVIAAGSLITRDVPPGETVRERAPSRPDATAPNPFAAHTALLRETMRDVPPPSDPQSAGLMIAVFTHDGRQIQLHRATQRFPTADLTRCVELLRDDLAKAAPPEAA